MNVKAIYQQLNRSSQLINGLLELSSAYRCHNTRRTMSIKPQIALLTLFLAGVSSCSSKPDDGPNSRYHSTRFPQTRTISESKVWLHWSDSERLAFVRGLIIGYRQGNDDACNGGAGVTVAQDSCRQRTERLPPSSASLVTDDPVNEYSKAMTKFYENHPEDDDVPIDVLFRWLVFERKNPTEVHRLLTPRSF